MLNERLSARRGIRHFCAHAALLLASDFAFDRLLKQDDIANYGTDQQRTQANERQPQGQYAEQAYDWPEQKTSNQQGKPWRSLAEYEPAHSVDAQEIQQQLYHQGSNVGLRS